MLQGVFLIIWFIAWLFYQQIQKQVKIFTVIYYKMPIPCNNMVNSIENAYIKGSCGILWYPAVSCGNQTDPFWVTFCSNRNTLTFDSNSYKKTNLPGVKTIVIVSPFPLVDAHTIICPKY